MLFSDPSEVDPNAFNKVRSWVKPGVDHSVEDGHAFSNSGPSPLRDHITFVYSIRELLDQFAEGKQDCQTTLNTFENDNILQPLPSEKRGHSTGNQTDGHILSTELESVALDDNFFDELPLL